MLNWMLNCASTFLLVGLIAIFLGIAGVATMLGGLAQSFLTISFVLYLGGIFMQHDAL